MAKVLGEHLVISTVFLFLVAISIVGAQVGDGDKRDIYLVLMEGEGAAFHLGEGRSRRDMSSDEICRAHAEKLVNTHDQLLLNTLEDGTYNKLYSFKHVVNGFAVHATPSQAERLKGAEGVKLMEKDPGAKLMTTYTPEFLELPEGAWRQQGGEKRAGEGIVIGFVDTGIDPTHPSFSARCPVGATCWGRKNASRFSGQCQTGPMFPEGSCNGKIAAARFFPLGAQHVATLNSSVDILSPFDAAGHGSHVAATAAGNADVPVIVNGHYYGLSSGMAPAARIAVYKAIFPTVSTITDVLAAIDQAVHDGVDVLTLSVGPDGPPRGHTLLGVFDMFMLFARKAGVFVVQAAGNSGPSPSSVISYSPWAVGAAASSTDRTYPGSLILGNGTSVPGVGLSAPTPGSGLSTYRLVLAKDGLSPKRAFPRTAPYTEECQRPEAFDRIKVRGSIVICTFSTGFVNRTSSVSAILSTARDLQLAGFILVANPHYGDFIAEPIPFPVSGIMITRVADTKKIMQYYEQQTSRDKAGVVTHFGARAAIGEGRDAAFVRRAPIVSRFSARGPDLIDADKNPVDVLKPDILAPGHQVWAAWSPMSASEPILRGHSFALLSGTSMAAPHVAGIAALIKQAKPTWTTSMIASAMSTTASKYDNFGDTIMAESFDFSLTTSTPFDIGSGHINPTRAVDPGLVFFTEYRDYIDFLCSVPELPTAAVEASTGEPCTHKLAHPSDLNTPSVAISALFKSITVQRSVKNVGRVQETYLSSVLPPNGTTVSVSPDWFTINPGDIRDLDIEINVTRATSRFSFGEIVLIGSLNHNIRIPLAVRSVSLL